jgi:hypothetical protein
MIRLLPRNVIEHTAACFPWVDDVPAFVSARVAVLPDHHIRAIAAELQVDSLGTRGAVVRRLAAWKRKAGV